MRDGFVRVACATPRTVVADCGANAQSIIEICSQAAQAGASLVCFPELCLTGYTCGDLFLQKRLLNEAERALLDIAKETAGLDCLIVVGLPVRSGGALYNCAAVLAHGSVLGLVPKQNIPNYAEFYELRHFTPGPKDAVAMIGGQEVPLGWGLLFAWRSLPDFILGVEVCEDLWVAQPPSGALAQAGATVIANPSASDETVGKADYRRMLVAAQSARLSCAYLYCDAGPGESTTDMVFAGHNLIAEYGSILAETPLHSQQLILSEIDVERLTAERRRQNTFKQDDAPCRTIWFDLPLKEITLRRQIPKRPFVPEGAQQLARRASEILDIQSAGLARRMEHIRARHAVIAQSGGLDSTLALIVAVRAFDRLGLSKSGIHAVSMPCFGTTARTKSNAQKLAEAYGVSFKEIPITDSVLQHFKDLGHDPDDHSVVYENAQARERTQMMMDMANGLGGLMIGTGDLSELALGWATYNGDHMSMYGVNASIPKTLVRHLVAYEADCAPQPLADVLRDILDTPVSPELLPPVDGQIAQRTEEIVGPYDLHDFFLYHMLRFGFTPRKIHRLCVAAYADEVDPAIIKKWLIVFLRRFFSQQFKRSCLPDGPKVGSVSLSPRGDWRMPSDASAKAWLDEAESIEA